MWDPRRLTTLWASIACYRDRFTIFSWQYPKLRTETNVGRDPYFPEVLVVFRSPYKQMSLRYNKLRYILLQLHSIQFII
jgi:hypothetical protein